ncbi:uncharacterized protein LOC110836848 [Zootermopsis nevadensis]|uniref:Uncharacterized protein n=1 Tax=Zootermopsis nevadensis TaxID=136037 RepID=A0A067R209_ZOONE|nr:uncharacterized protein LOC110836848 [Zootermopsis nevadensis]KDR11698.1 hypothetical protein L798_14193 [Zootermopsis nevadensis]
MAPIVLVITYLLGTALATGTIRATFTFPEFQYKETSKNEMAFREFESACKQSPTCAQMSGITRVRCVRECISPSCYQDIYQSDQLEEGEIDVRLNSFKGCFIQRAGRQRP